MNNRKYPTADDTTNRPDPQTVARIVRSAWTARVALADYRKAKRPTPYEGLERRCEALEAALYHLATGQVS